MIQEEITYTVREIEFSRIIRLLPILLLIAIISGLIFSYWIPSPDEVDTSTQQWSNLGPLSLSIGVISTISVLVFPREPVFVAAAIGIGVSIAGYLPALYDVLHTPMSNAVEPVYYLLMGVFLLGFLMFFSCFLFQLYRHIVN